MDKQDVRNDHHKDTINHPDHVGLTGSRIKGLLYNVVLGGSLLLGHPVVGQAPLAQSAGEVGQGSIHTNKLKSGAPGKRQWQGTKYWPYSQQFADRRPVNISESYILSSIGSIKYAREDGWIIGQTGVAFFDEKNDPTIQEIPLSSEQRALIGNIDTFVVDDTDWNDDYYSLLRKEGALRPTIGYIAGDLGGIFLKKEANKIVVDNDPVPWKNIGPILERGPNSVLGERGACSWEFYQDRPSIELVVDPVKVGKVIGWNGSSIGNPGFRCERGVAGIPGLNPDFIHSDQKNRIYNLPVFPIDTSYFGPVISYGYLDVMNGRIHAQNGCILIDHNTGKKKSSFHWDSGTLEKDDKKTNIDMSVLGHFVEQRVDERGNIIVVGKNGILTLSLETGEFSVIKNINSSILDFVKNDDTISIGQDGNFLILKSDRSNRYKAVFDSETGKMISYTGPVKDWMVATEDIYDKTSWKRGLSKREVGSTIYFHCDKGIFRISDYSIEKGTINTSISDLVKIDLNVGENIDFITELLKANDGSNLNEISVRTSDKTLHEKIDEGAKDALRKKFPHLKRIIFPLSFRFDKEADEYVPDIFVEVKIVK